MLKRDKTLKLRNLEDAVLVTASFPLRVGANSWSDIQIDSIERAIKSLDREIQIIDSINTFRVENVDCKELQEKLIKWGFKPEIEDTILEEPKDVKISRKKNITKNVKIDSPKILALDLNFLVKEGKPFKTYERLFDSESCPTVGEILKKTVDRLKIKNTDRAIAIFVVDFVSILEYENKILSRVIAFFKNFSREEFIEKHRNELMKKIYREFYELSDKIKGVNKSIKLEEIKAGTRIVLGNEQWLVVDGHKIYDLIYKFGSQTSRSIYHYKNFLILKPYRGDFIFIINKDYLVTFKDEELIEFKLWKDKDEIEKN